MFLDFGRKLQRDLQRVVDARLKLSEELSGGRIKVRSHDSLISRLCDVTHVRRYLCSFLNAVLFSFQPKPIEVQVISHHMQRYAVWFGGSMLASSVVLHLQSTMHFGHVLMRSNFNINIFGMHRK